MKRLAIGLWILTVVCSADGDDAKLNGTPTATRGEIAFAVSAPVDVTVRVVDAKGEVVRHLACGMVGLEAAAKPFAPKSLVQKLAWDGNDDAGKPVPAGSKAVIALGTRAKFDKFVLSNPDGFGNLGNANWSAPGAIAVGPKGELFVVEQYGVHYSTMRVFDREGKYVRTVWPLSMSKPKDVLEPFLAGTMTIWPADVAPWNATDWAGHTVPRSVMHSAFYWYGVKSPSMVVGPRSGCGFLFRFFCSFRISVRMSADLSMALTPSSGRLLCAALPWTMILA